MKLEAMTQKAEDLIIYGSKATDPGAFNGLAVRYGVSTSRPNADTTWPYNVKLAGGSGSDTASAWVIQWGAGKVFGIYPKNLPAGIKIDDLGEDTVNTNTEAAPKWMRVYMTHIALYFGINVEDERCVQRLANIESAGSSNIFDPEHLLEIISNLPDRDGAVIYVPRAILTQMEIAAMTKNNAYYTSNGEGDVFGRPLLRFHGVPVKKAEMLDITETAIS